MSTLVVDFDDTLAVTHSRDWENATPRWDVIDKVNALAARGWFIIILTARGSLTCKSRNEAREKYYAQIASWLDKHGVKYNLISFNKPLARYYVDDKAITPEEFSKLKVQSLVGGISGAGVERVGDLVYKTSSNSYEVAQWYKEASMYVNVPKIHSVVGNVICMDYIEDNDRKDIGQILSILGIFSKTQKYGAPWSTYVDRIKKHLDEAGDALSSLDIMKYLDAGTMHSRMYDASSFSHGDFSLDNIIANNGKLYLIDPLTTPEVYSAALLDGAKLLLSCKKNGLTSSYSYVLADMCKAISAKQALTLELSQWIRIRKYSSDKAAVDSEIFNLYNWMEEV